MARRPLHRERRATVVSTAGPAWRMRGPRTRPTLSTALAFGSPPPERTHVRLLSRRPATLLAVGALLLTSAGTASASASTVADPVVEILPVTSIVDGATVPIVDGPFDLVVQVTGGGASAIELTPVLPSWNWSSPAPPQTVPGGSCPVKCTRTWRIDPGSQATPWPQGWKPLAVTAVVDGQSIMTYGGAVDHQPVVPSTEVVGVTADASAAHPGWAASVADTGAQVTFRGAPGHHLDEQVVVSVLPLPGSDAASSTLGVPALATTTATWDPDPDAYGRSTGQAHLDTSAVPEGSYRIVAQAHDGAGHYSYADAGGLLVRHSPLVSLQRPGTAKVSTGSTFDTTLKVGNPRATAASPLATVKLTVAGKVSLLTDTAAWSITTPDTTPSMRTISIPTTGMPLGPVPVTAEVFDAAGDSLGTATTSFEVVDYHDTLSIPTLVVGKPAQLRLNATRPAGTTLGLCLLTLATAPEQYQSANLCPNPTAATVAGTATFTPVYAGAATVREQILPGDSAVGPDRAVPVTIYANRTASVTAPSSASYNSTQTATITVKDEKKQGSPTSAGSGVTVTLQRKPAGATAWTTIGSATTATTGVATVKYANTTSGRLRALVRGAVPATTLTTAERAVTSIATVAWSSLPTTARSGATVTAAVYAKPYQTGALVTFQARKLGATTWATFGSGSVGTSGYAKATGRLYSRGTWEVRVQRAGTTTQATGYSSTRRVTIS